jgi:hypothetical protein
LRVLNQVLSWTLGRKLTHGTKRYSSPNSRAT